jgi:hypothetical protein
MAIQYSMGWLNYHLHEFRKDGKAYSPKTDDDIGHWDDSFMFDYKNMKISDILMQENEKIEYEYDFGDGWEHDIKLEKVLNIDGNLPYPICIKGKMACPPEDCGGIWGYHDMLEGLKDPKHEMHREYREWIDPDFDPETFDIEEANAQLTSRFLDGLGDLI